MMHVSVAWQRHTVFRYNYKGFSRFTQSDAHYVMAMTVEIVRTLTLLLPMLAQQLSHPGVRNSVQWKRHLVFGILGLIEVGCTMRVW